MRVLFSPSEGKDFIACLESTKGHSALPSLNSSLGNHSRNAKAPLHCGARLSAPHSQGFSVAQSNTANTRIVCGEIQDSQNNSESTASDSHSISESAFPVIASNAKQSTETDSKTMDCHAGLAPAHNDDKTESHPHANLESNTDSETPSGGVYLHRDKNKNARSANLEGVVGGERYICERIARGEGATSPNLQVWISPAASSSPSPLDEKEKEILKNNRILEVKTEDSERLDSESKNQTESAQAKDFKKVDLQSKKLETYSYASLESPAQESIRAYLSFLHSASDAQIATLFGSKTLNLDELSLAQNLLHAPRIEAVRLYNGVAYKALDFASLDSEAQAYVRENLYIFSNLFAMVRADTPLPYYNLHQGKGRGALSLQHIYAAHRERIDGELRDCEVLDLRAEAYCKVYECRSARSLFKVEFLKNGKKVSHYAKHYRGIYARALAQSGITSLSQLQDLHIKDLSLTQVEQRQNATILVYEVLT